MVVPGNNFFALARILGLGWLLAGMGVLYVALRRFGVEVPFAVAGAAALPLVPGVLARLNTATTTRPPFSAVGPLLVAARILVGGTRLGMPLL